MEYVPDAGEVASMSAEETDLRDEIQRLLPATTTSQDPLAYLVACEAMTFFPTYCRLSRLFEYYGYPQFSALPLRRSLVQSHVQIDTMIVYRHVLGITRKEAESLPDMKHDLWGRLFRMESKAFQPRSGMVFDGSISTNGLRLTET